MNPSATADFSTSTFDGLAETLTSTFQVEEQLISPGAALETLGLDSLALMEFVFAVEDRFHIRIPEDRLDPREAGITLGRLCEVVDQLRLGAGDPAAGHA